MSNNERLHLSGEHGTRSRALCARHRTPASELPGQAIPAHQLPAIAFTHAGALLSLLTWWIDRGMREPPAEMDELFHRMVWKGASTDYTESA